MKLCDDCRLNQCDDCYQHDCDCNLSSHSLAAALILKFGADYLSSLEETEIEAGAITLQICTPNGADDSAEFNLLINGRTYHVTVKA